MARIELTKTKPNYKIVSDGFIQGHIHPDDIGQVIILLHQFSWVTYIQEAVGTWTKGDMLLVDLRNQADEFHRLVLSKELSTNIS
jgi:hypothetical protein